MQVEGFSREVLSARIDVPDFGIQVPGIRVGVLGISRASELIP